MVQSPLISKNANQNTCHVQTQFAKRLEIIFVLYDHALFKTQIMFVLYDHTLFKTQIMFVLYNHAIIHN